MYFNCMLMIAIMLKLDGCHYSCLLFNICMCVAVILIGVAQCVSPSSFNRWHTTHRNIFCFAAPFNVKHYHLKITLYPFCFLWLCKNFCINFWGEVLLLVTLHLVSYIYI